MMRALLFALLLLIAAPLTAQPRITEIAKGLDHPWSLAFLPDGRVLVTERAGRLRVIGQDGQLGTIAGLAPAFAAGLLVQGQAGLFDVVLHPRFAENRLIYLSFAEGRHTANQTAVARARLEGNTLKEVRVIWRNTPAKRGAVHFGGRMAFLPDETLMITTGDGFDFREQAQVPTSGLGKTMRLAADGTIPPDNPRPGSALYTSGHRNPQGLALDPATGRLWSHEHGPRGGDELNLIQKGRNYGWPIATHGLDYSGATISPFTSYRGTEEPRAIWVPSIAPSGLAVYRGTMFPEWQGSLILGALAAREVRRVTLDRQGRKASEERILPQLSARIRDVRVAPDGALWLTTDDARGKVLRVTR
jgi:glucose/arabinose dehydrogenase